jgi:hypothetical protein
LPEGSPVLHLPAFNGFGAVPVRFVRGQGVLQGPASNTGAIGFAVAAPEHFTGCGVVGTGRLGTEPLAPQLGDFGRPEWAVGASGQAGHPALGLSLSAATQVTGVEAVEMTA